jgi:hypothetical protein
MTCADADERSLAAGSVAAPPSKRGSAALARGRRAERRGRPSRDGGTGSGGLCVRARSSVASVPLAAPTIARSSPSTADWLSESCESAPSRWSLVHPRVLVRERLT